MNDEEIENPHIEILGDTTLVHYADGRTSILRGQDKQDLSSPTLKVISPLPAEKAVRMTTRLARVFPRLLGWITLASLRRPVEKIDHARKIASPAASAYPGAEASSG